jgi:ABC-type amino acid transport substrate-binding protein
MLKRTSCLACLVVIALGSLAATGCGEDDVDASASRLDTIEPGKLKVAVQPYMPYTGVKGGQLEGLDSEILEAVAERLDLEIQPQVTDFNGMLGGVQSRRVDITIGGVAWSEDRQKQGLFTDPPYYSPPAVGVRSGKTYSTIADLEGLSLGTVTGYVWVKSIKAIPAPIFTPTRTRPASSTIWARAGSTEASSIPSSSRTRRRSGRTWGSSSSISSRPRTRRSRSGPTTSSCART